MAFLLFAFGFVAQEIAGGESMAFDRRIILALRNPANPGEPWGPPWLQEAARDGADRLWLIRSGERDLFDRGAQPAVLRTLPGSLHID